MKKLRVQGEKTEGTVIQKKSKGNWKLESAYPMELKGWDEMELNGWDEMALKGWDEMELKGWGMKWN